MSATVFSTFPNYAFVCADMFLSVSARNALLTEQRHAVVADFGLSRQVDPGDKNYTMQSNSALPYRWYRFFVAFRYF